MSDLILMVFNEYSLKECSKIYGKITLFCGNYNVIIRVYGGYLMEYKCESNHEIIISLSRKTNKNNLFILSKNFMEYIMGNDFRNLNDEDKLTNDERKLFL